MDKNSLRKKNLAIRCTLNQKPASEIIVSKIFLTEAFLKSKNVLIFYPMKTEIDLRGLLGVQNKNFFLPRVCGKDLLICPYTENLRKSAFNVMEPVSEPVSDISIIDIVFVPCLAIDKNLNRLGYGKGYYDRLFRKPEFKAQKIAVLNKELLTYKIPVSSWDEKVDSVITD